MLMKFNSEASLLDIKRLSGSGGRYKGPMSSCRACGFKNHFE
jgi:hypothetical protein